MSSCGCGNRSGGSCRCHGTLVECQECETFPLERVNFYDGQFLVGRDLSDEQGFHVGRDRAQNRLLHGTGTVCGLRVVEHPDPACRDRYLVIEPGSALDCCGRWVRLEDRVHVDIPGLLAENPPDPQPDAKTLLVSLCYDECKTEYVPVLYSDCGCDEDRCEPNRIREHYKVELRMVPEAPVHEVCKGPAGLALERLSTLNVAQPARIAVDEAKDRIYLLSAPAAGQVFVYSAPDGCLLRTIDLNARGLDIAVSPAGDRLYALLHVPNPPNPGGYVLRTLDITDLNAPAPIGLDLAAGDGAADAERAQLWVSTTRVFAFNPAKKSVFVFNANPQPASFNEYAPGADPRTTAVTPDGNWLFTGLAVAADNHVLATEVASLVPGPPVTHKLPLPDIPAALGVSGDGRRLFVATSAKKLHLFYVQTGPPPFPQAGAGVDVVDDVLAVRANQSGTWAYVLGRQGAAVKAVIRAVNAGKIETDPARAVRGPAESGTGPLDLELDEDSRRMYAVFAGAPNEPCAGAAVFEVIPSDCEEILWHTLDCCPECGDDRCIPLAVVRDYQSGQPVTNERIDNRVRNVVPSVETLRDLILCCCEHAAEGKEGPAGPEGPLGPQGPQGVCECCEEDLARISALSWTHDAAGDAFADVGGVPGTTPRPGLVVRFEKPNTPRPMQSLSASTLQHVFRVEAERPEEAVFHCYCELSGNVVAVDNVNVQNNRIVSASITTQATAEGFAFLPSASALSYLRELQTAARVTLLGDFLLDADGKAADVEFARHELKTGDRPANADQGIQGGTFRSWFWPQNAGRPIRDLIRVNQADLEQLTFVLEPRLAQAIVTGRRRGPYRTPRDLVARARLSPEQAAAVEPFLSFE